jgi:rare lipoprotein A (peptidoglycan hydrolase)
MSKWRVGAAAGVLSLFAACAALVPHLAVGTDAQVSLKGDKLQMRAPSQMAEMTQPSPWMQVMQRFGALRGTSSDPALTNLLRVARVADAGGATLVAQTTDETGEAAYANVLGAPQADAQSEVSAPSKADPSLDTLAAKVAQRLGSKLHMVFAGRASFYSLPGQQVASGGQFVPEGLTAAHRTLPFGTRLRVTDPKSGRSVVVVVNDRGPYIGGRVLDLSLGAARALGMTDRGVIQVRAEVI